MKKHIFLLLLLGMGLCLGAVLSPAGDARAFWGKSHSAVKAEGDDVRLASSGVTDKAGFYSFAVDGKKVLFFVVRDNTGKARVALDACDSCWREGKGYTQEGNAFLCKNCGIKFPTNRISERKGGCNPHPVSSREENGQLLIPVSDLRDGVRFFN